MALVASTGPLRAGLHATPASVTLDGPEATQQLLIRLVHADSSSRDVTRQARYEVTDRRIAHVDEFGLVEPLAEGSTEIRIRHESQEARVTIHVRGLTHPKPVSFEQQIIPLLTKAGCNAGSCHGKAEGQNGFKLSVFGFDPDADYQALAMEARGRRVFPAAPAQSLLLKKATAQMPHGGGRKIMEGSLPYKRLQRWIVEGMSFRTQQAAPVEAIAVEPEQQVLTLRSSQQLRVTAIDASGHRHCVTAEAEYESNAPNIAGVDRRGGVQASVIPGEAAILVRYMGHVTVCRITIPRLGVKFVRPPEANFIDQHVWNKLEQLGIPPSEFAPDAVFLRRVYLDLIGTLPTAAEARAFFTSTDPKKRSKLIDALLDRPEYADYMAMRWADLLRVDRDAITAEGAVAMTRWLRRQFAENRPYDQFVRAILTARGNTTFESPAAFYKVLGTPEVMSRSISQLFLGVRIECAQCHHHPSEKWSQDDYAALAGFFTGVARKTLPTGGEAIVLKPGADLNHPRTGKSVHARPLGAAPASFVPGADRRAVLADWMTSPDNPYLARAAVNRLWSHLFGRGLVEPIDDLRATNPATNEQLLEDLARHFREQHYDVKALLRTILNSRAYQLGLQTTANARDEQNFSHAVPRAMPAEVLLDAVCQATGIPEKFNGWPEGVRAIQVWDNRMPSYFMQLFGRPVRASVCECERSNEPSIAQALHLMNSQEVMAKVHGRRGVARQLADSDKSPEAIVEELYLGTLARLPTEKERALTLQLFRETGSNRRAVVEDILWALLNTKEFVYNH